MSKIFNQLLMMLVKLRIYIVGYFIGVSTTFVDHMLYVGFNKSDFTMLVISIVMAWAFQNKKVLGFLVEIPIP